ncbi:hypothetical protein BS50DRAFT_589280 [Corynespora cassiicola Philippines]|uniref:Invertebrate defensins family profile domain-containing protein n=1 Tax=Corynespora cassiicola Philippines TaxID=1448308 RepID=A0A2T2NHG6_CORCC|nr:hypothetical protein BS50DRAFT_589280 [Corynespora cassiicola Philippines]
MHARTVLVTIFIAMAVALPPAKNETYSIQATETNIQAEDKVSIMAQKNWQASGGCKPDWDENRRCLSQCIGEANSRCPRWKSMTAILQGGCILWWKTCRCVCEY